MLVSFIFSFARVHSLLLWSQVIEQHTDNSQFSIIVGCLEKSSKSLIIISIISVNAHNHLENEKEKPQETTKFEFLNAPEFM